MDFYMNIQHMVNILSFQSRGCKFTPCYDKMIGYLLLASSSSREEMSANSFSSHSVGDRQERPHAFTCMSKKKKWPMYCTMATLWVGLGNTVYAFLWPSSFGLCSVQGNYVLKFNKSCTVCNYSVCVEEMPWVAYEDSIWEAFQFAAIAEVCPLVRIFNDILPACCRLLCR